MPGSSHGKSWESLPVDSPSWGESTEAAPKVPGEAYIPYDGLYPIHPDAPVLPNQETTPVTGAQVSSNISEQKRPRSYTPGNPKIGRPGEVMNWGDHWDGVEINDIPSFDGRPNISPHWYDEKGEFVHTPVVMGIGFGDHSDPQHFHEAASPNLPNLQMSPLQKLKNFIKKVSEGSQDQDPLMMPVDPQVTGTLPHTVGAITSKTVFDIQTRDDNSKQTKAMAGNERPKSSTSDYYPVHPMAPALPYYEEVHDRDQSKSASTTPPPLSEVDNSKAAEYWTSWSGDNDALWALGDNAGAMLIDDDELPVPAPRKVSVRDKAMMQHMKIFPQFQRIILANKQALMERSLWINEKDGFVDEQALSTMMNPGRFYFLRRAVGFMRFWEASDSPRVILVKKAALKFWSPVQEIFIPGGMDAPQPNGIQPEGSSNSYTFAEIPADRPVLLFSPTLGKEATNELNDLLKKCQCAIRLSTLPQVIEEKDGLPESYAVDFSSLEIFSTEKGALPHERQLAIKRRIVEDGQLRLAFGLPSEFLRENAGVSIGFPVVGHVERVLVQAHQGADAGAADLTLGVSISFREMPEGVKREVILRYASERMDEIAKQQALLSEKIDQAIAQMKGVGINVGDIDEDGGLFERSESLQGEIKSKLTLVRNTQKSLQKGIEMVLRSFDTGDDRQSGSQEASKSTFGRG